MKTWLPALGLVGGLGCGGESPSVEILSATPEAIVTADDANDDLTLLVRYEDPNGDLGGGSARVHDCRAADVTTTLPLPIIADEEGVEAQIAIGGELQLVLSDIGAVASEAKVPGVCHTAGAERGAFCVVLVDTAGNESEPACTSTLRIE